MNKVILYRLINGEHAILKPVLDQVLSPTKIGAVDYYCIHSIAVKPNLDYADLLELPGAIFYPCSLVSKIEVTSLVSE